MVALPQEARERATSCGGAPFFLYAVFIKLWVLHDSSVLTSFKSLCFIYFDIWNLLSPPPKIIFIQLMMKFIKLLVGLPHH